MANPLQPLLDQLPAPLRNKYFVASVLFFGWMVFFDKHNILTQIELHGTLRQLQQDKMEYQQSMDDAWEDRQDLEINKEKYAREHYYLKKRNEDVYIIED